MVSNPREPVGPKLSRVCRRLAALALPALDAKDEELALAPL